MNTLKSTELYTLKEWVVWNVNYLNKAAGCFSKKEKNRWGNVISPGVHLFSGLVNPPVLRGPYDLSLTASVAGWGSISQCALWNPLGSQRVELNIKWGDWHPGVLKPRHTVLGWASPFSPGRSRGSAGLLKYIIPHYTEPETWRNAVFCFVLHCEPQPKPHQYLRGSCWQWGINAEADAIEPTLKVLLKSKGEASVSSTWTDSFEQNHTWNTYIETLKKQMTIKIPSEIIRNPRVRW